jgi:hypothetical protein
MSHRTKLAFACAVVILAACGVPQQTEETTTTATESLVTTTTPAPTTTSAPSTTTTSLSVEDDAAAFLAAVDSGSEIESGRIEGSIVMSGLDAATAGFSEVEILFSSAFDATTGNTSFAMDMSSMVSALEGDDTDPFAGLFAGMLGEMEVRQIGETVFLKFPFFSSLFGAETEWISMPADEAGEFTSGFETMPTDPSEVLGSFEDAGGTVENLGTEEVNGVQATHYLVSIDADAMELTPAEEAELAESGMFVDGVVPLDIWLSDGGQVVRMIVEIDGSGIDAPPGEGFETMTMRYDMIDINGDIVIEEPPASEVTPIEDLEGAALGFDE